VFRVGGERYAEENGTFGLATLRRDHVRLQGDGVCFEYTAKGGADRQICIDDDQVERAVREMMEAPPEWPELLGWWEADRWRDVRSADINGYLKAVTHDTFSAKDFRTWHGTVLAALLLAQAEATPGKSGRKRAVAGVVKDVAAFLGNTPAVCRKSYIDPRVVDLYAEGVTIRETVERLPDGADPTDPEVHAVLEQAVLDLLEGVSGETASGREAA
jgi:DNA topoisomerase IB